MMKYIAWDIAVIGSGPDGLAEAIAAYDQCSKSLNCKKCFAMSSAGSCGGPKACDASSSSTVVTIAWEQGFNRHAIRSARLST